MVGQVSQSRPSKDATGISFEDPKVRGRILASYWIVIFLALPLWWYTTSIQRLTLPLHRVFNQGERQLRFPVIINLDATTFYPDAGIFASDLKEHMDKAIQTAPDRWKGLQIQTNSNDQNRSSGPGVYSVTAGWKTQVDRDRQLSLSETDLNSPSHLADILLALLSPYSDIPRSHTREQRVAQYARHYRLAFTLLNEDAASGRQVLGWDIQSAITTFLSPTIISLSILHNFTIESQVQFHAPLAFQPQKLDTEQGDVFGLTPEDLTVFVNSAEWTLSSSVSNDPVLHFVLFVPSSSHSPLYMLDNHHAPTHSNAFILPQWGGIFILNTTNIPDTRHLSASDLKPVMAAFSSQLLAILGAPTLPAGVGSSYRAVLSDWQLDALIRRRTMENVGGAQDTLYSIVKLVDQIDNMPVGTDVRGDVQDALAALDQVYHAAASSPVEALRWSSDAMFLASRAFFNPGMLGLLYFPAEHKYAVYSPLFASVAVPLVVALLREFSAWKNRQNT